MASSNDIGASGSQGGGSGGASGRRLQTRRRWQAADTAMPCQSKNVKSNASAVFSQKLQPVISELHLPKNSVGKKAKTELEGKKAQFVVTILLCLLEDSGLTNGAQHMS
jgi:hypothetical protein